MSKKVKTIGDHVVDHYERVRLNAKSLMRGMRVNERLRYCQVNVNTFIKKYDGIPTASDIDWDYITELIMTDIHPDDFNAFPIPNFCSFNDMYNVRFMVEEAMKGNNNDMIWRTDICKDCGAAIEIRAGEMIFYKQKGYNLPKRCPNCRGFRREQQRKNKTQSEETKDA